MFTRLDKYVPNDETYARTTITSDEVIELADEINELFSSCTLWVKGEPIVTNVDKWIKRLDEMKEKYGSNFLATAYNTRSLLERMDQERAYLNSMNKANPYPTKIGRSGSCQKK